MATSTYFNHYYATNEQQLFEGFMVESIQQYGINVYYVPRVIGNLDQLYTADDQSSYEDAYLVDVYPKNITEFGGSGNLMSKFGLDIHDQLVFQIASKTFRTEVGEHANLVRPREGDLIYFPLNQKVFQIKYVDKFDVFFQGGQLPAYDLTCELFEYSNEVFNTGIEGIDRIQETQSTNILDYGLDVGDETFLTDESGRILTIETYDLADIINTGVNDEIEHEANTFIDWNETDPFSEFYEEY